MSREQACPLSLDDQGSLSTFWGVGCIEGHDHARLQRPSACSCSIAGHGGNRRSSQASSLHRPRVRQGRGIGHEYRFESGAVDETGIPATVVGWRDGTTDNQLNVFVPPMLVSTEMSATITPPDTGGWVKVHAHRVTARYVDRFGPSGFGLGWTWPERDRSTARTAGWQMFGSDGQANACGAPSRDSLEVHARRTSTGMPLQAHTYITQDGVTITAQFDIYENRLIGGLIVGNCMPGDLIETVVFETHISIEEFFEGVTLTSESGLVTFSIRAVGFRTVLIG